MALTDTRNQSRHELVVPEHSVPSTGGTRDLSPDNLGELKAQIRAAIDSVSTELGEDRIGGPRHPPTLAFHSRDKVEARVETQVPRLTAKLKVWSAEFGQFGCVAVLYHLWEQAYEVLQVTLAYDSLEVVRRAAKQFVEEEEKPSAGDAIGHWKAEATSALAVAMELITTDGALFKLVNLSNADGLSVAAQHAARRARAISKLLKDLLPPPSTGRYGPQPPEIIVGALTGVGQTAELLSVFYDGGASAADGVLEFENWLKNAPVLDSADHGSVGSGSELAASNHTEAIDTAITAIRGFMRNAENASGKDADIIRRMSEPWERMLVEIQKITTSSDQHVFVPNRASIVYCYPFAVDSTAHHPPWGNEITPAGEGNVTPVYADALSAALAALNISCGKPKSLGESQFFNRGGGRYGGVKIELQGIKLQDFLSPVVHGQDASDDVWLELSDMGNHCLCIKPPQFYKPLPHVLYRAVRAGTPFVVGASVVVSQPKFAAEIGKVPAAPDLPAAGTTGPWPVREEPATRTDVLWDNLHLFSRDVVAAVARGLLTPETEKLKLETQNLQRDRKTHPADSLQDLEQELQDREQELQDREQEFLEEHFEPGNLHEIVVVNTLAPASPEPRAIAAALDGSIGGRILLRSTHQAASTLEEWVRYPSVLHQDDPPIEDSPVVGFAGDWFANTGEMTVFGFVAAPPWHVDVYTEAARFASSWSPLLRMWSRRLQSMIVRSRLGADEPGTQNAPSGDDRSQIEMGDLLRSVEKKVRLHLMQIGAEDLCATQAHRRFLDQLLRMAQLDRLQAELESQLVATEHLIDWDAEEKRRDADHKRQQSERSRNVLLTVITLLGIFGLSGFLGDIHKAVGQRFLFIFRVPSQSIIDDELLVIVFLLGLALAVIFGMFGEPGRDFTRRWMRKAIAPFVHFGKVCQSLPKMLKGKTAKPNRHKE